MTFIASAVSIGSSVSMRLAREGTLQVSACFDRAIHLTDDDLTMTIGSRVIGRGPCNVLLRPEDWTELAMRAEIGAAWRLRHDRLIGPGQEIVARPDVVWTQPPWPRPGTSAEVARMLALLTIKVTTIASPDTRLFDGGKRASDRIAETLDREVAVLAAWLKLPTGTPPTGLLGLGAGLTPAGDDIVAGVLITLDALGAVGLRDRLAVAVLSEMRQRTSLLSATLLTEAAAGRAGEHHCDVISSLLTADGPLFEASTDEVLRHGATSGADFLTGVILAAGAVTAAGSSEC